MFHLKKVDWVVRLPLSHSRFFLMIPCTTVIIHKQFWKYWLFSEIHNTFVFHSTWKRWKMAHNLWNQRWWSLVVMLPNPDSLRIFYYLLPSARFYFGSFYRNIRASTIINIFYKCWHWSKLFRSAATRIRWPDIVQLLWWQLDENRLNEAGNIQSFLVFFQVWYFPLGIED